VLWANRTTCKKLIVKTPFRLVYGQEEVVPLDYLIPSLRIATITDMTERGAIMGKINSTHGIRRRRNHSWFPSRRYKKKDKAWHDRHIKKNNFKLVYLVLLYDSKYL
jgi:hypothetical protein